jgi:UDP-N-acetylmuramate dehydrogenase
MIIQENIRLAEYTTFKIGGPARFFCSVENEDDVREAVVFAKKMKIPFFVIGGGSNLLISDNGFPGLVIKMENKGIEEKVGRSKEYEVRSMKQKVGGSSGSLQSDPDFDSTIISAAAGESWDSFIDYTISKGYSGLENLSAIPGTVGATPVQNIGAYGAEAGQFISSVRAFDTRRMVFVNLSNKDCKFAYRDSMFKHRKGRYVVTRVDFKLKKDSTVNIEYKDLQKYFNDQGSMINGNDHTATHLPILTPADVRKAVVDIRWKKLPDWKLWGTAGSFFKNPVVSALKYARLKKKYPDMPGFKESFGKVKIPLGWVLDNVCHVKGMQKGSVGTYEKQALVFVAKPGATSAEVVTLAQELMKKVKDATGITIEGEVEWVN